MVFPVPILPPQSHEKAARTNESRGSRGRREAEPEGLQDSVLVKSFVLGGTTLGGGGRGFGDGKTGHPSVWAGRSMREEDGGAVCRGGGGSSERRGEKGNAGLVSLGSLESKRKKSRRYGLNTWGKSVIELKGMCP